MTRHPHTLKLLPSEIEMTLPDGASLRQALEPRGVEFPCGGRGHCHGCRVRIVEGALRATDLIPRMEAAGARRFIYTDIGRDGTLAGPNLEQLRAVAACCTVAKVVASGGVARVEDIAAVRTLGVEGIIVGKALYDGAVQLPAALAAAGGGAS